MMRRWGAALAAIALMGVLSGCVALGGEPPIVRTRVAATPVPATPTPPPVASELGHPAQPPDLANGALIYARHCAACHGDGGRGDGPVALNAEMNPGDLTDPTSARSQTPFDWYSTITYGRIENLMPPWRDALTEQERWDVAMYTYTYHVEAEQLALGQVLYQECADCHGDLGRGDGPEAANLRIDVKDLTDQSAMVTLSDASIFRMVEQGFEDVMPSYSDRFSADEMWAVTAYARSLSLAQGQATEADPEGIAVSGTVSLYGGGQALPVGLMVNLNALDTETGEPIQLNVAPAAVGVDGAYAFAGVPRVEAAAYFTSVIYQRYPFASAPRQATPTDALTLDIVLYSPTTDPNNALVSTWVNQITAYDGQLDVVSVMQVQNPSQSEMYSSGEFLADGRPIGFRLPIPDGATLIPPDLPGVVVAEDGRSLIDTQPLPPRGQKLLSVRYTLPYTLGQPVPLSAPLTVAGTVRVLLRPLEMRLVSDMLPALGEESLGGEFYKVYGGQVAQRANAPIEVVLEGQPLAGAVALPTAAPTESAIPTGAIDIPSAVRGDILNPILIGLGLLVVVGTLVLLLRRPARKTPPTQEPHS